LRDVAGLTDEYRVYLRTFDDFEAEKAFEFALIDNFDMMREFSDDSIA